MSEKIKDLHKNKIILTLLNGTGYVFDVKDYMTLRSKHRIVGALVGTCCNKGWSGNDCTMPVELAEHETRLLLEQGIATLVSKKQSLLKTTTEGEQAQCKREFQQRLLEQAEALKNEKLKESERNLSKIMAGKRKKLLKSGVKEEDINLTPEEILQDIGNSFVFEEKNALVEIPLAHPEPHDALEVDFCQTEDRSLKYLAFRDLWLDGHYVTCGDAFGADFLLYPGDPSLYHASHIVILKESSQIMPLEFIAKVRLSVIVNKRCVFAYFDDENLEQKSTELNAADASTSSKALELPKIIYQTATWQGNKEKEERTK